MQLGFKEKNLKFIVAFILSLFIITPPNVNAAEYTLDIDFTDNLELTDNGILLFQAENASPGDSFITDLTVTNNTSLSVHFAIDDIFTDNPVFENEMLYQLYDDKNNIIYSADSNFTREITEFSPGEEKKYTIRSSIKNSANNRIQNQSATFSFVFRVYTIDEIPDVPETGEIILQYIIPGAKSVPTYIVGFVTIFFLFFLKKRKKNQKTIVTAESKQKE